MKKLMEAMLEEIEHEEEDNHVAAFKAEINEGDVVD
jgi:hypothetical protein